MRKLLHQTHTTLTNLSSTPIPSYPIPSPTMGLPSSSTSPHPPPTPLDTLRYRSHHGVNLGGIFVLEKWLYPSMFGAGAGGDSEMDAVSA